jgi:hypothetical protein
VNNEQGSKHKARGIVHHHPLVPWDTEISYPPTPESSFWQEKIENKPGYERRQECDKAGDIHKRVYGYAFHK